MAHVRKDTLSPPGEWAKHLRPRGKKAQSKTERQEAKKEIKPIRGQQEYGVSLDDILNTLTLMLL